MLNEWNINGKKASGIAFGTHNIGNRLSESESFRLLDEFVCSGGNIIDTARCYGNSESCIGKWMESRKNRDKIILMTKCANPEITYYENGGGNARHRINPAEIKSDIERSLNELKVECFDILFIHKDNPDIPAEEIFDMLLPYREKNIAAEIGVSNWSAERIKAANDYAQKNGKKGFTFSELSFSLKDRVTEGWGEIELALEMNGTEFSAYTENRMHVFGYSSQASGFFFKPISFDASLKNKQLYDALYAIAQKNNINIHKALFGFYNACPINLTPIFTSSSAERVKETVDNSGYLLNRQDTEALLKLRFGL